jgi:transposase
VLAVLHTWSQNLKHHLHLHCLVPAGLAFDNFRWVPTRRHGFFLPVRVLSCMFRGKLLAFLKQSYRRNELWLPGKRRRTLGYRELLVKQMVQMKNRVSGLLMEKGVTHTKRRLHKVGYFAELMAGNEEIDQSIRPLLKLSREHIVRAQKLDYALVSSLERDPLLVERLKRLRTVPGVGPITARTWALEIGDVSRFRSIKQAISYCGLCGAEKSSADKVMRTPISKQRNKHVQHVLVEAAKLAPRQCHNWR